jgi:hypothetical protein
MANVVTLQASQKDTVYPDATFDVNVAQVQQIWVLDDDTDCILRFPNGEQLRVRESALTDGYRSAVFARVGLFERYEFAGPIDAHKPRVRWINLDFVRWLRPTERRGAFEIVWASGGEPLLVHKRA